MFFTLSDCRKLRSALHSFEIYLQNIYNIVITTYCYIQHLRFEVELTSFIDRKTWLHSFGSFIFTYIYIYENCKHNFQVLHRRVQRTIMLFASSSGFPISNKAIKYNRNKSGLWIGKCISSYLPLQAPAYMSAFFFFSIGIHCLFSPINPILWMESRIIEVNASCQSTQHQNLKPILLCLLQFVSCRWAYRCGLPDSRKLLCWTFGSNADLWLLVWTDMTDTYWHNFATIRWWMLQCITSSHI